MIGIFRWRGLENTGMKFWPRPSLAHETKIWWLRVRNRRVFQKKWASTYPAWGMSVSGAGVRGDMS